MSVILIPKTIKQWFMCKMIAFENTQFRFQLFDKYQTNACSRLYDTENHINIIIIN